MISAIVTCIVLIVVFGLIVWAGRKEKEKNENEN